MKNIRGSGIQGAMGTSGGNVRQASGPPGILNGNTSNEKAATQELDMLLKSHSRLDNILNTRDIGSLHRSGSAPPSVEGSLASISGNQLLGSGGVIGSGIVESEQQLRSDPTYLAYYYSHVSLNPRLPPPLITRENYHLAQQLAAGRLKSLDNSNGRSLFLSQSMLPTHKEEPELEDEKLPLRKEVRGDGSSAYASRSNNMVGRLQEDASGTSTSHSNASNPAMNSRSTTPNPLLSSRSTTPKPAIIHMLSNSTVGSVSRIPTSEQTGRLAGVTGTAELAARLQNINLSGSSDKQEEDSVQLQYALQQTIRAQQHQNPHLISGPESSNRIQARYNPSNSTTSLQQQVSGATNNMAAAMSYMATNPYYPSLHAYAPLYGLGAYAAVNPSLIPAVMANYPSYDTTSTRTSPSGSSNGVGADVQQLYKYSSQSGVPLQTLQDPLYYHYLQQYSAENARNTLNLGDPRGPYGSVDPLEMQKNQINSLLQLSRGVPYGVQPGNKNNSYAPAYYGAPGIGFVMPYGSSSISTPLLPGSPMVANAFSLRQTDPRIPVGVGRTNVHMGTSDSGEEIRGSTLLEELKNNKTRKFELADIAGHVVEFSSDQHGSRFIQQKLESVSLEEKESVFQEVLPHAFNLMTDVFGNYVIQKFLEHGSLTQRLQLIEQLVGHVLALTLQMYGCRVIQKALEVVDVEQQIKIISELDGHVMRCVRDQNGNHVIQKCIECVPSEHILFILSSFKGQVVVLSTHPYGCRVIQRVLEHCNDEQKQGGIMKEILDDVCTLAQDQYGNYVVQHILEHGKPEEKTEILTKMLGQIVQMSQHKFASNVVEKCLEFGGPKERQMLITEMLGETDENEPLQAMMKDQFANYVVQKVLETCDDQQREVLLSRIRIHLHALKKYTYGKHIVTRVEKLVMAGERRGAATV